VADAQNGKKPAVPLCTATHGRIQPVRLGGGNFSNIW